MDRRQYLRRVAAGTAAGVVATAGCASLGGGGGDGGGNPNTVLPEPDLDAAPEKYPFPQWSQRLPEVTLPAALQDRTVTTTEFDTPLALTFIFTSCETACPVLTLALKRAQEDAIDGGYADAVNFAEISFDPARDTPAAFREYADERNVDLEAGNWHFLLPESEARARDVVEGEFGLFFEKAPMSPTPAGSTSTGTATTADPSTASPTPQGTVTGDDYMFNHATLILLVNGDNYVERAYRDGNAATRQLTEDMQTLVEA